MAIHSSCVFEVRTDGNDLNGGGYRTPSSGTDRSQQTAPHATLTAASVVHTTTTQVNVDAGDFIVSAADVGNILQAAGGTSTAGHFEIITVDVPNNRWTVDRALGTAGQTVVGRMGGCLASPGKASGAKVASNHVWIKAGTYVISVGTPNVINGLVSETGASRWEGYEVTRGDLGVAPVLEVAATVTGVAIWTVTSTTVLRNITIDGMLRSVLRGFTLGGATQGYKLTARNCTNGGYSGGSLYSCVATGCTGTTAITGVSHAFYCESYGNSCPGFNGGGLLYRCLSYNNGASIGYNMTSNSAVLINCVSYGHTLDGFKIGDTSIVINCIAVSNTGYGFFSGATRINTTVRNCAGYGNTTADIHPTDFPGNTGFVTLTADPFTNAPAGDFSLNNVAGGGAALRAAGYPVAFPRGLTPIHPLDIGAAQAVPSGGGGPVATSLRGGFSN